MSTLWEKQAPARVKKTPSGPAEAADAPKPAKAVKATKKKPASKKG